MNALTDDSLLAMSTEEIVAYFSPFCKHTPLSAEHAKIESDKIAKKEAALAKKQQKQAEQEAKAAEKELIARMSPEQAKAYRKNKKLEKQMAGQPTLL